MSVRLKEWQLRDKVGNASPNGVCLVVQQQALGTEDLHVFQGLGKA